MIVVTLWFVRNSIANVPLNKTSYNKLHWMAKRFLVKVSHYTSFLEDSRFLLGRHEEGLDKAIINKEPFNVVSLPPPQKDKVVVVSKPQE